MKKHNSVFTQYVHSKSNLNMNHCRYCNDNYIINKHNSIVHRYYVI